MTEITEDEYKKIVLEILCIIDKVCRENKMEYRICYGTLLGAVRHGGFIPWDDDVDIIMKREDYDRLRDILNSKEYGLNFIDIHSSEDTIYAFGKVCKKNTILMENNFKNVKDYGAFVDVFPLDFAPESKIKRKLQRKKFRFYEYLIQHGSRVAVVKTNSKIINFKRELAFRIGKLFNTQKLIKKLDDDLRKGNKNKTSYYRVLWGDIFPVHMIDNRSEVQFEGHAFYAPYNPDEILTQLYGDYLKLPQQEQRVSNHDFTCYYKESQAMD